jgi:hypothetical protein
MSVDEKSIENFAELFHHYHSALAPDFGCGTSAEVEWDKLASGERKRLVAATRLALTELQSHAGGGSGNIFTRWPEGGTEGRDCGC